MNRLDELKTLIEVSKKWGHRVSLPVEDLERLVAVVEVMTTIRDMLSDPPTRTLDKIGRAYGFARDVLAYWLEDKP